MAHILHWHYHEYWQWILGCKVIWNVGVREHMKMGVREHMKKNPIRSGACYNLNTTARICCATPTTRPLGGALSAVRAQCNYLGVWP